MAEPAAAAIRRPLPRPPLAALLCGTLAIGAGVLTAFNFAEALPPGEWGTALRLGDAAPMRMIVFTFAVLPRLPAALLAGAALGAAGALFQHGLRNPLAVPDTLGVTAGAQLALATVTLVAPASLALGRGAIAFAGGLLAVALVGSLSWRRGLRPLTVLLTGLVVTLHAGALGTLLMLFHAHDLSGLTLWASGSLDLQDWSPVTTLALGVGLLALPVVLLRRALGLLSLDDGTLRGIGGAVAALRLAALGLGVALCAVVTATFGAIGFIGLAAPNLARFGGARRFPARLAWSALLGALLLWSADAISQRVSAVVGTDLPTGALTALCGTPLLVWLAGRARDAPAPSPPDTDPPAGSRRGTAGLLGGLALLVAATTVAALVIGRTPAGWTVTGPPDLGPLWPWRGPRTLAAAAAGGLLALSGTILQRAARNPVAAPEMLGLSAGAGIGLVAAVMGFGAEPPAQALAAMGGALLVGGALLLWGLRSGFESARLLVTGLSLATCVGAVTGVLAALGDPRAIPVMTWMAGSTARVAPAGAAAAGAGLLVLLPGLWLLRRWLAVVPLGTGIAQALGVPQRGAPAAMFGLAAVLAACGTLIVGPLSFVGLVAPHMALRCGLRRPVAQGLGAVLCGALLMTLADWGGRTLNVPWQLPSGIVAALVGAPVLLVLLRREGP